MAVDPLIELSDVNEYNGELHVLRDLRDIGPTVGKGEVVVVIGPSGSGTSTPCRTVERLESVRPGTAGPVGRRLPAEGRPPARLGGVRLSRAQLRGVRPGSAGEHRRDGADRRSPELLDSRGPLARVGRPTRTAFTADGRTVFTLNGRALFTPHGRTDFTPHGRTVEDHVPEEFATSPDRGRAKDFLPKILMH
ncbi:hypothetical protein [Streptomyces sp. NPDC006012]|uniref:hypothetical protein n=1 Tax=Streptomyces sp. NPDC006012 TaxID=3364739 RepID=UPI0036AD91FD